MSMDLKFEEEPIRPVRSTAEGAFVYSRFDPKDRIPGIVRFFMKIKFIGSEKRAKIAVLVIVVLLFILTIVLIKHAVSTPVVVRLQLTK